MSGTVALSMVPYAGADFVTPLKAGDGIRLRGGTSGYVGLKPAAAAGATDFTLPVADGVGTWLSNGAGALSIETAEATKTRLGLSSTDDVTFDDLTVTNLTVNGTTTTINSTVIAVIDPLIKLATSNPADLLDIGVYGTYVSTGTKYTGLFRDASDSGKYKLFTGLTEEPTTTVNVAGTGYTAGYLVVGTIEATTYVGYPATNPAGSGTELQYRSSATAFGAVSGTSISGSTITLSSIVSLGSISIGSSDFVVGRKLYVVGELSVSAAFAQYTDDADAFDINFRKSRGTVASPTVITTGDPLGSLNFQGYSGAGGYVTGAQIRAESTGTIASTRVPGKIVFATATDATPSVLTDRMTILNSGNVGIGTASSQTKLEVVGDANTFIMRAPTASSYGSFRIYNDQNSGGRALEIGYGGSQAGLLLIDGIYGETAYITTTGAKAIQFGTGNTYRMGINTNGLVGINKSSSIGAQLHVVPSSSTTIGQIIQGAASQSANLQEWQNSAGTVLAKIDSAGIAASTGVTIGGGTNITKVLSATGVLDFASTAAGAVTDLTVTVTGAVVGDTVAIGIPNGSITATGSFTGWVSAANTVTIRFSHNHLVNAEDPASGTFRVTVTQF